MVVSDCWVEDCLAGGGAPEAVMVVRLLLVHPVGLSVLGLGPVKLCVGTPSGVGQSPVVLS